MNKSTAVKESLWITCEHCGETTNVRSYDLTCGNPHCQAHLHPEDTLLYGLFGVAVQVASTPLRVLVSTVSPILPLDQMAAHIVDISKWQYLWDDALQMYLPPDFDKMRDETDTIFVIHKFSQGTSPDPTCNMGLALMASKGIRFGGYHFCDPAADAKESARFFAQQINAIDGDQIWGTWEFPQFWLDVEKRTGPGGVVLSRHALTVWVKAFIDELQLYTSQPFGIYTREYWWNDYIERNEWAHLYALWIARYNPYITDPGAPLDWKNYGKYPILWQRDADGNGLGAEYGVYSKSIDRNRSPLLTRDQVLEIIGTGTTEPPPTAVSADRFETLFADQNFRTEPSTSGGGSTVIRKLPSGSVLVSSVCYSAGCEYYGMRTFIPGLDRPKEIWLHGYDDLGQEGWLAAYHPSREGVFVKSIEPLLEEDPPGGEELVKVMVKEGEKVPAMSYTRVNEKGYPIIDVNVYQESGDEELIWRNNSGQADTLMVRKGAAQVDGSLRYLIVREDVNKHGYPELYIRGDKVSKLE